MKKLFLLLVAVLSISLAASAQTRTVTGTVEDANTGEPLIGASVTAGSAMGVATDVDGNFTIQVPAKTTHLEVSYVGYTTKKVDIAGKNQILVKLEPSAQALDEVIAVAYGESKKSAFTGSATVIKADEIENTQVTNPLDALKGRVAGVQINSGSGQPGGSSPSILIRGITSINAGNSPLIIVDGTPYGGDMNSISTHDIESMTVLKDAASNALYGARGANGVILITTKSGKSNHGEAIVTLDAKWGSNSRASRLYKTINDPVQYYETFYSALYNSQVYGQTNPNRELAYLSANNMIFLDSEKGGLGYNIFTDVPGQMYFGRDGRLNPAAKIGRLVNYGGEDFYVTPDNWLDEAYHNSLRQEYNFSVSNGNERSRFYASVGYLDNDGITDNTNYSRLNGRLSAELQAKEWLKISATATYSHFEMNSLNDEGNSASSGNVFAAATQMAPIYPLYIRDGQGNIRKDSRGLTLYDYGNGSNAGMMRPVFPQSNAIDAAILDVNNEEGNQFTGVGSAEIRFLKDFKFTSNNSFDIVEYRDKGVTNPYFGSYASMNGMVTISHSRDLSYSLQQLLNWSHVFGMHEVNVLLGHEYNKQSSAALYAAGSNMFDMSNTELAGVTNREGGSSEIGDYNNEGYIFRGQYNYNNLYFLSGSFRRDGSSRFHPDHRWGNFWSLGAAWMLSKEAFFNADWIDQLKVKASYGEQGNDRIGNYLYTDTYQLFNSDGVPTVVPSSKGNPDISWEKNGNFNAGFEFSFWNTRLTGGAEFFYRKTTDMLSAFYLPASWGYTGYYANIGDMSNIGVEIDLTGVIVNTRDLRWDINLNFTWYKNRVLRIADRNKTLNVDGHGGYVSGTSYYGEGLPLFTYYMPKYAGVDPETGQSLWYREKPLLDDGGNPILGADNTPKTETVKTSDYSEASDYLCKGALPNVYGGFGTTVQYKDFDLALDFAYQLGGQCYDGDYASLMGSPYGGNTGSAIHADVLKAWTPENTSSDIPRWMFGDQYNSATSDRFLTPASYLSLNNINFGYSLPKSIISPLRLTKVRLYFTAENVWVWSKRQGMDPRQSVSGGVNNSAYAPMRTLSGGINVTF